MITSVEYNPLEEIAINAQTIPMTFQSGDKIKLRYGLEEGKPTINIIMPWGNIFKIGEYESAQEARREYARYQNELKQGYSIHIVSPHNPLTKSQPRRCLD